MVVREVQNEELTIKKIAGACNPADLLTKYVPEARSVALCEIMGC